MSVAYLPPASSEFPNDNPVLSRGVRWVCRRPLGEARALVRPGVLEGRAAPARPSPGEPPALAPALRYEGPLDIDPARMVLRHRAADVPPPPSFVLEPFRCLTRQEELAREDVAREEAADEEIAIGPEAPPAVARLPKAAEHEAEAAVETQAAAVEVLRCVTLSAAGSEASELSGLPRPTELDRAIAELDAAFAEADPASGEASAVARAANRDG